MKPDDAITHIDNVTADGPISVVGVAGPGDSLANEETFEFFEKMQKTGVKYIICTDISKDGAMRGTNLAMYSELSRRFDMCITASGGVSSLQDVELLNKMGLYGAIIGKAYYTGAIDLSEAIKLAN